MRGKEKRGNKGGEERSCYSEPACRFRGQCDGFTSALPRESFVPIHWNSLRSRVLLALVQLTYRSTLVERKQERKCKRQQKAGGRSVELAQISRNSKSVCVFSLFPNNVALYSQTIAHCIPASGHTGSKEMLNTQCRHNFVYFTEIKACSLPNTRQTYITG